MKYLLLIIFSFQYLTIEAQDLFEYLERRSKEEVQAGNFSSAKEYIDTAIALYPDSAIFYYHRGGNYFFVDSLQLAKQNFEVYIDMDPQIDDVYKYYGFTLHGLGQLNEAKINYTKYLESDPKDEDVIMNLAIIDWKQEDKEASKKRINEYVGSPRQNAIINVGYASFLAGEKEVEFAEDYLTKAVELDPENPEYLIYRGRFYHEFDQPEKCCYDLKSAFELGNYEAGNLYVKLDCATVIDETIDRGPPPPAAISSPPPKGR